MAKTPSAFFENWDDETNRDQNLWRLMMSIDSSGEVHDLKHFDIQPEDPMDAFLKSLQNAVVSVERVNGSLQEQVQVLLRYFVLMKKDHARLVKRVETLENDKRRPKKA